MKKNLSDIEQKVVKTITAYGMFDKGETIFVAVSGGADSVCLLTVLYALRKMFAINIGVIHLNHMLLFIEVRIKKGVGKDLLFEEGLINFVFSQNSSPYECMDSDLIDSSGKPFCPVEDGLNGIVEFRNGHARGFRFADDFIEALDDARAAVLFALGANPLAHKHATASPRVNQPKRAPRKIARSGSPPPVARSNARLDTECPDSGWSVGSAPSALLFA